MGDVALGQRPSRRQIGMAESRQRHRQDAHGRAIAGVAFEERSFDRALRDIAADAAAAGVADVDRTCLQPCREFIANIVRRRGLPAAPANGQATKPFQYRRSLGPGRGAASRLL